MGKRQELLDAAREGDRKTVEKILAQITKRSGPFTSLSRRGAGVNVQDDNGYTPLHHACLRGHKDIVSLLLSVDASPCVVDKKGATPLHLAAWKGDSDVVSMLLAHKNPPVNIDQLTSDQDTALVIAAQFGNVDVVAQLLSRGADVTVRNIKDESALDLAAQYGRLETVEHLLRARPQLVDPFRFPVGRGRSFSSTPLHRASKNGHKEVVSTLIKAGMDPNVKTHNGTALHEAANYGKESVVRVLLAKGADLNIQDRRGRTVHDLLNEYSEVSTRRVRKVLEKYMTTSYGSEEDLPQFPVDYSPSGYVNTLEMPTPETPSIHKSFSSSSSISTKNHPSSLVQRLTNKYQNIKARFSSDPNISNTVRRESDGKTNYNLKKSSTNWSIVGNSRFLGFRHKKDEEVGEVQCNDEFDTLSLDIQHLDRSAVANRSNRSCPGLSSLPSISENVEISDSRLSQSSIEIVELDNKNNNKLCTRSEVIDTPKLSIFEPRSKDNTNPRKSNSSAESDVFDNEFYVSYEFVDPIKDTNKPSDTNKIDLKPKPPPRPTVTVRKQVNDQVEYVNVAPTKIDPPKPAARTHITPVITKNIQYENIIPKPVLKLRQAPDPPKRIVLPVQTEVIQEVIEEQNETPSPGDSRSSSSSESNDSLNDEADFEDVLLSTKSKSFRHGRKLPPRTDNQKVKVVKRSVSTNSDSSESDSSESSESSVSSDVTEASALDNMDVSAELNDKSMYLSMTGTLPSKKSERAVKKKVLFRHKTFTNIEVDRNSTNKDSPKWNNEFIKETLPNYHIRGTGHCIYKAPTVQEFLHVFNRNTLRSDTAHEREIDFETAICFCKPKQPKFHKSAEDLLVLTHNQTQIEEKVTIDFDALREVNELRSTSFQCFCDTGTCKFHERRESPNHLVVKFSVIQKSISTPDITLNPRSPSPVERPLTKINSVPYNLEEHPNAVSVKTAVNRTTSNESDANSNQGCAKSQTSTMSTASRPYSVKDIAEEISLTSADSSLASDVIKYLRETSSSDQSGQWSLHTCNSNVTIKSDMSFQSCLDELDSSDEGTLQSDGDTSDTDTASVTKPWVHSDSFRFNSVESKEDKESGIETCSELSPNERGVDSLASLENGKGAVRRGSGRRRWDEVEGASEGDALSVSSAASSCAPHHLMHHQEYSKVSPTPPKKPPRRNLSVSPTHVNSPSSGYSYELRAHARSQDDLDDLQGSKSYLKHGRSVDHCVDGKLSYSEYEENHNSPRVAPIPNPRPSLKTRLQPTAITTMYENVVIKEQNPKRKLRRNNFEPQEDRMTDNRRKYQERSSLESLLDDTQSMNSPSDCERYIDGSRVKIPLSPTHYEQPPTPEHPPPSARQAENSIHERIRPLSQEYKRRSAQRDSYTETGDLLRAASAASVASGATDRSGTDAVEEYVADVPFAGLFKGSTTTLDGIGLRPVPAERPKTLRKLKSVYDSSPTDLPGSNNIHTNSNGQAERLNGEEEVRRRSNTTSSSHSGDKSLSILSPFDEQEEWAKISEIMASFGSKLVRESVFVSELEQEFTSRLGLSCSESSLSPSVASTLGLWLSGLGLQDYEPLFLESGFDDIDFVNGILEDGDLKEIGIDEADRIKILESTKQLPLKIAEISNNHNNNNVSKNTDSVEDWLKNINLEQYTDTFRKHLYVDMDRVKRIWEVELTAVLEIQKAGHRKRILASVSGQQNGPATHFEDINADLKNLKSNIQQLKEEIKEKDKLPEHLKAVPPPVVPSLAPPGGETLKRSKKNRPAPQPPRPSDLEIRAPSELLVGVPGALKTQWKHQPFVLVTGAVTYVANYLGSTVVKELRGTESTKKSIQKLKKSTKEPRDSPDIILSISYRGVKFLNTITRELICEHEIRNIHCACQDADDLTHFAYITKDHATKSHFCHVFCVATMDQATEVILTLGEAFEVAYQMALREQSNRSRLPIQAKTPTHDPTTHAKEKQNLNHGRSHSITEIKLNGHQLKVAPIPVSLSNEDFQATRVSDVSRSPRTPLLKAPIASTEEL